MDAVRVKDVPLGWMSPPAPEEVCGAMKLMPEGVRGRARQAAPHCCLPSTFCFSENQKRKTSPPPASGGDAGVAGPFPANELMALPEMTSFVRQISSLGSFLISAMSSTGTLPAPQALRKPGCTASLCSTLCLFIIHGTVFVS